MANPQRENGHIDIANELADKFCSFRISGQEWQIIWVVLRKTWGWLINPKDKNSLKKKMDRISESQFAELTGIDRRKCHTLLKKLTNRNILIKSATHKEGKIIVSYGFQKDFDSWKLPPIKRAATYKEGSLPPIKRAKLPPIKRHTKEKKETITKDIPLGIYNFYKTEINPTRKSSTRAKTNIKYYLKKYSQEQLEDSIKNYKTVMGKDQDYRKDPANFFGRNDQYFLDYLPGNFETPKKENDENPVEYQPPIEEQLS